MASSDSFIFAKLCYGNCEKSVVRTLREAFSNAGERGRAQLDPITIQKEQKPAWVGPSVLRTEVRRWQVTTPPHALQGEGTQKNLVFYLQGLPYHLVPKEETC